MKPGIYYPQRKKCPRCKSGNIIELSNIIKLASIKNKVRVAEYDTPRWNCKTCDYEWSEL